MKLILKDSFHTLMIIAIKNLNKFMKNDEFFKKSSGKNGGGRCLFRCCLMGLEYGRPEKCVD